jgi:hypothetical protein
MYKGNNMITLNQATILEAINMWLKDQHAIGKAPVATFVSAKTQATAATFEVSLSAPEESK